MSHSKFLLASQVVVSHATRGPRPGEVEGVAYHFTNDDAFSALASQDGFVEHTTFNGHRYGTTWNALKPGLGDGALSLSVEVSSLEVGQLQAMWRSLTLDLCNGTMDGRVNYYCTYRTKQEAISILLSPLFCYKPIEEQYSVNPHLGCSLGNKQPTAAGEVHHLLPDKIRDLTMPTGEQTERRITYIDGDSRPKRMGRQGDCIVAVDTNGG
ncbi:hypothetical protein TEQG_07847 [Trichophyton equinum CBS 127.97]|uniref:Guanylate kinase-like domain-containing protein n=1 Tax=Trichophyton equinum (strain ATCC MYA-4606 / CBS 127.97) TaxID=559882 RepID=F2Q3X8_TRIEC|nr:hypothetical protein TEQG_07847 [Trichophyton equinum CBS 127.97]